MDTQLHHRIARLPAQLVFWRLGFLGLLDPDEAHYAELTREMMRGRSWMIPLLDGTPFIDKPVLFHWLQAAFVRLLGESELALRMPSAIAAVCLVAPIWWVATRLFDRKVGELAALMFVTMPATFALASVGLFDMVFAAFLFGGLSCLMLSSIDARERLQYAGYVLLALAVMIKGPVAMVLVALLFAAAWCASPGSRLVMRRLQWPIGLAMIGLTTLPWFVWMSVTFGDRFVRDYVFAGNLWYFTSPRQFSTRSSDYAFYLRTFFGAFFPWSVILLGGALDHARDRLKGAPVNQGVVWLSLWLAVVIAFFGLELDGRAVMLPAILIAGGAALHNQMRTHRWNVPSSAFPLIFTFVASLGVVVQLGFPLLESSRPTRPLGRWIATHTAAGVAVGIYRLEDWRASIRYYANRPVTRLENVDDVRSFFLMEPTAKALMLRSDYRAMRDAGLEVQEVAARRAIVGRTGKDPRRQVWGQPVVVTRRDYAESVRTQWDVQ